MKKFFGFVARLFVVALISIAVSSFLDKKPSSPAGTGTGTGSRQPAVTVYESHPAESLDPAKPLDPTERYKNSLCAVSLLNATEKHIYCALRDEFSRVANGLRSSTEFTVDVTGLGITYTFGTLLGIDMHKLRQALWLDCPQEMYWNYRSKGWQYEGEYETESKLAASSNGSVVSLTIRCEVLPEYAPSQSDGNKYITDPEKISAAKRALQNAQALVYQCRSLSDYEKLAAYRDYICDQVEYNDYAAALPEEDKGKGPWQIIYVFDNDPTTNVVCEGYAKAFKYLCDLSDFSGDVGCYLVNGTTTGPHMWNLVRINGRNYMADITGCDSEWGQYGGLFLAGAKDATGDGFTVQCPQYNVPNAGYHYPAVDKPYRYSDETKQLYLHFYLILEPTNFDPAAVS